MRNNGIWILAIALLLTGDALLAQNPLRAQTAQNLTEQTQGDRDIVSRIVGSESSTSQPHYDPNVVQAGFNRLPSNSPDLDRLGHSELQSISSRRTAATLQPDRQMNFIERDQANLVDDEKVNVTPSKQNLGQLISKLGMNLAFVLFIAIGFVLLAKQWIYRQPKSKSGNSSNAETLQINETLVLDSKTTLRVVQWRKSKILLASDTQGIKSMVVLNPSFDETLEDVSHAELPDEPVSTKPRPRMNRTRNLTETSSSSNGIDERLIQMLLDNANRQSTKRK